MSRPAVTVLIPARNEAGDLGRCLEHVLAQDVPLEALQVVVVDGGSTDGTAAVADAALRGSAVDWVVVPNPAGTTPSNLNAGLAVATAPVLCRVDARSLVPPNYARVCAEVLDERPDVVVVGGAQVATSPGDGVVASGIARALNNRYGMGLSRYRRGAHSGPTDTVYLGAFRTESLRAAGGWDEAMLSNQDFELNRRLGGDGVVWFDERLPVGYIPRRDLRALLQQYHRFGRWKVRYWRRTGERPEGRQLVLLASPLLALAGAVGLARLGGGRAVVGGVVAAAVVVDQAGSRGRAPLGARAVAVAALGAVAGGWLSGVAREALTR